jgi:hypothetical protein
MSLLLHADLLKAYLDTVVELEGVYVHVDRKFNLRDVALAELEKKTSGAFLGISLGGWSPENPDAGPGDYVATLRYELSFSTVPHILEELGMPSFDALLTRIINAIHGWRPETASAFQCPNRWQVGSGSFVPDDSFIVYLFAATITEEFADPITEPEAE